MFSDYLPFQNLIYVIRLFFYRMVKRMRRLISGQTEVARICGENRDHSDQPAHHSPQMTAALWEEWTTSKKLHDIFTQYGKDPNIPVDQVASHICGTKRIAESSVVVENLKLCLKDIQGVNVLIATVKGKANEPFDPQNPEHERKLEQLWQLLLPGQERAGGRYSKEWNRIGFQQSDPASDFRGGGMLGLDQLLFIASTRTAVARRMIVEPESDQSRYPWACVGINLTMEAIRILESRKVDLSLYGKSAENAMLVFHGLYASMFEVLHARWVQANPENVLAFPAVLKETLADIDEEISRTGWLVPPGAEA